MTEAERVVLDCEARGVVLALGETSDALDFDAPAGALTPELRARLRLNKADVIQVLFEREERAALSGCPANVSASQWARVMNHPAVLHLQRFGLCHSVAELRPMRRREEAA